MGYTVTIRYDYRPGCPECTSEATGIATAAFQDAGVTSFTMAAKVKCEHQKEQTRSISGAPLPGQQALPGLADGDTPTPTPAPPPLPSGFDSGMVTT